MRDNAQTREAKMRDTSGHFAAGNFFNAVIRASPSFIMAERKRYFEGSFIASAYWSLNCTVVGKDVSFVRLIIAARRCSQRINLLYARPMTRFHFIAGLDGWRR